MLYFCIHNGNSYHYYESHSISVIILIIHLIDIAELIPLIPSSPVAYWMAIGTLPQNLLSDLRKFCAWAYLWAWFGKWGLPVVESTPALALVLYNGAV